LEQVDKFTYLGSLVNHIGDAEADMNSRIGKESAVFQKLRPIWTSASIHLNIKIRLYATIVLPTAIYASETWKMTAGTAKKWTYSTRDASDEFSVSAISTMSPIRKSCDEAECAS